MCENCNLTSCNCDTQDFLRNNECTDNDTTLDGNYIDLKKTKSDDISSTQITSKNTSVNKENEKLRTLDLSLDHNFVSSQNFNTNSYSTQNQNDSKIIEERNTFFYKKKGLHVANLNIQHLLPKLDEIKFHLSLPNSTDILGLCETFLNQSIENKQIHINNFKIERKDRSGKVGGGLVVYISDIISYTRRFDLEHEDIESICIQVNPSYSKPFLINFFYRPPDSKQSWIDTFESLLDKMDILNYELHCLGDII